MISIIIPTYNSTRTIKRCFDSILKQTYKDYEVLVMDGVSKDDTLSLVQSYNDSRIHIYSEPDKGIYEAMNKGILKSHGEWLYFLGSDDSLYKEKVLENVVKELTEGCDVVYGEVDAPQLSEGYQGEWTPQLVGYNRCHQAIFYRREIFKRLGLYNLEYKLYADYDLNIKWLFDRRIKSKHIDVIVANYSEGGASATGQDKAFWRDYEWNILKRGWNEFSKSERLEYMQRASNTARVNNKKCRYIYLRIVKLLYRIF